MLRFDPGAPWPLLLAAVRDELVERDWDPPGQHWPHLTPTLTGGRDRKAGGTWLAVRRNAPALAAVLNAPPLPPPPPGTSRPSRGELPLLALTSPGGPDPDQLTRYDAFHLVIATTGTVSVWSWDGKEVEHQVLPPGDHIAVNLGLNTVDDPLVPHFAPLLTATPSPPVPAEGPTREVWDGWVDLLAGDELAGDDPRALIIKKQLENGRWYGSTSASLVALGRDHVRMDFTATPEEPSWYEVPVP